MFLKATLLLTTTLLVSTSAQFFDYSIIQTQLNDLAYGAEKDLQTDRLEISEYVLAATDEMILYATNSLTGVSDDPASPMIAACTLYPTNWMSHHTKELNEKFAEVQGTVNYMKFAILNALVNQPMISDAQGTYNNVKSVTDYVMSSWYQTRNSLLLEISAFKLKIDQLVIDMQECIRISNN